MPICGSGLPKGESGEGAFCEGAQGENQDKVLGGEN